MERSMRMINGTFSLPDPNNGATRGTVCGMDDKLNKVYSRGWISMDADFPLRNNLTIILFQVPAFILVSKALYFLLRPLKQPRIVCDAIAGVLLGPAVWRTGSGVIYESMMLRSILPIRSLAALGLVYHLFLMGVKMDPTMVIQSGRKALWVGVCSTIVPLAVSLASTFLLRDFLVPAIARGNFIIFLPAAASITAFPVLGDVLAELRILNTDLGRLGMSAAMINCLFGWLFMALFTAIQQHQNGWDATERSMMSLVGMLLGIVCLLGPCMRWIVRQTPKGTPVKERYILAILFCVIALAVVSDAIGASPVDGPLILGLLVPDGPPLGSALVKRVELIVSGLLMPLFFYAVGNLIKFPRHPAEWMAWMPVVAVFLIAYSAKMVGTILPAAMCNVPLRNAVMLGLIMSFRGVVEMITLFHLRYGNLLDQEGFTVLMILVVLSTAVAAPLVSTFYDPLATNRAGRRTIQHMRTHAELLVLACVHNESPVSSFIKLIEASSAKDEGPVSVYVLHLVELAGRANSTLIAHKNRRGILNNNGMDRLLNAFTNYETQKKGRLTILPFTSVTPYTSMHQDICSLAVDKRVSLVVIPYPRKDATVEDTPADLAIRSSVPQILAVASCSVGILVHHTLNSRVLPTPHNFQYHIAVLFWGGPDDREALSYASRMARHAGVTLKVIRLVPAMDMRENKERQLDESLVEDFQIAHSNNARVSYKDFIAKDAEETMELIRSIDTDYDLIIVGRRQGASSCLSEDLLEWIESPELGIVGDMLASPDLKCASTILVMQQHGGR